MELLINDQSVHAQFNNSADFQESVTALLAIRELAQSASHEVLFSGGLLVTQPIKGKTFQQVIGMFGHGLKMKLIAWLGNARLSWDNNRYHGENDFLDYKGNVVTDTAIGEATYRKLHGQNAGLISFSPSDWNFSPVPVTWIREAERLENQNTELDNWWDLANFKTDLNQITPEIENWGDLHQAAISRFTNLIFADNCFEPLLSGVTFKKSGAKRFMELLDILNRMAQAFDANGERSAEGQKLYDTFFVGREAWFSDSTDEEFNQFKSKLTFPNPDNPAEPLECRWHGKVKLQEIPLRLHYSWTMRAGDPVYVVYAGPKLTMKH